MKFSMNLLLVSISLGLASTVLAGDPHKHHKGDFEVGVDPQTNQLVVLFDAKAFPMILPDSKFPLLPGFALDDPGFLSLDDEKAKSKGLRPVDQDALIALEVLELETSGSPLRVWDPLGPGEDGFQIIGERRWNIGRPPFDEHPYWHIDTSHPDYKPGVAYEVTFRVLDLSGRVRHEPSELITVSFVPEPGSLALLLCGALSVLRRRSSGR